MDGTTQASRFGSLLFACVGLGMLAMWAIFGGIAYETYQTGLQSADTFAGNVAALLTQDVTRNIEMYDLSLKAADEYASDQAIMALPAGSRRKALFDRSANASGLGLILVVDKTGAIVANSSGDIPAGLDVSDREYFTAQRDGLVGAQPFISHPFKSRISSKSVIALSRPRLTSAGVFDGIVVGTITMDYFAHLFRAVDLPPGSTITLFHRDGTILARAPYVENQIGRQYPILGLSENDEPAPKGAFRKVSPVDGIERMFAYREVAGLPVYMAVGLSMHEALKHWRFRVGVIGLGFVMLSGIVLVLALALSRELKRRTVAEHALAELAATDGLTQLANRRRFDEVLDTEWRRAVRDATPLSLLMIDQDFFKAYNDTYGHVEGDAALRRIAETLRLCVERPGDLVARFGGEEFVVLLPQTDRGGATGIGEAIRQRVRDLAMPHAGSPFGALTVSVGVATCRPTAAEAPSTLVHAADTALYAAKAEGRDRIVIEGNRATIAFGWRTIRSPKVA